MKMFFHTFKVVYVLQAKRWDAKSGDYELIGVFKTKKESF